MRTQVHGEYQKCSVDAVQKKQNKKRIRGFQFELKIGTGTVRKS